VTPYQQVIGIFNGKPLGVADVRALLPDLSLSTIKRALKSAEETGDLRKVGHKYQKTEKGQKVHAYSDEPFEPFSEPVEDVVDNSLFDEQLENEDEPGDHGDGDLRYHPDFVEEV